MLKITARKRWANFALDIELDMKPAFTALFGPSGCGKTTTLNLIAGLEKPDAGEIVLNDQTLFSSARKREVPPRQRNIGYIFQENRLFPHLSVQQNIEFGYKKVDKRQRKFQFDEIIERIGIAELLQRKPGSLSGGEKQRVAIARSLLASPDYLLMDEPLSALDHRVRLSLLKFLKDLHRVYELPVLYVSHDLSSVLNFADQVAVLQGGRCIGYGSPFSLLDKLATPPLVSRDDISNIFEMAVTKHEAEKGVTEVKLGELRFILPRLKTDIHAKLLLNIPASEIILALDKPTNISATNILEGNIEEIHYLGDRALVAVNSRAKFMVEVLPATVERLRLETGKRVYLIIKASSFRRLG